MTEENYHYRTSQTLLRNQFPGKGKLQIPIIPRFQEKPDDFDDLLLIGFDKTHLEDQNYLDRMVHFFLYDYRFERVWKSPDSDIEKLSRYRAVLPLISVCIWKWRPSCSFTTCSATVGAAPTGRPKESVSSPRSTGAMNPRSIFALRESKKAALWLFPHIWHLNMITAVTRKNGLWPDTMRCCGGLNRKKLSATIHRFQRCRETLYMWTMNEALGVTLMQNDHFTKKIWKIF